MKGICSLSELKIEALINKYLPMLISMENKHVQVSSLQTHFNCVCVLYTHDTITR